MRDFGHNANLLLFSFIRVKKKKKTKKKHPKNTHLVVTSNNLRWRKIISDVPDFNKNSTIYAIA